MTKSNDIFCIYVKREAKFNIVLFLFRIIVLNINFFRLLLRLPPLRALEPQVLEELFFAGLIGQVQIDSVIPYILRMGSSQGIINKYI